MKERIGITSDHAGVELKSLVCNFLSLRDCEVIDYGCNLENKLSVDYPDYASVLARNVSNGSIDKGIAICGTGIGMCIVANKFPGVRAASVWDEFSAKLCKAHNNANIICLGARAINHHRAISFIETWLDTSFEDGRHEERLKKIKEIEKLNLK